MSTTVVILGSSPNALVAAGYLHKEGHQVTVVEPSPRFGGPIESTSFEGRSGEQGLLSLALDPTVVRELELKLETQTTTHKTALAPDGSWVRFSHEELQGHVSTRDSKRWPEFVRLLDQTAKLIHSSSLRHPNPSAQAELIEPWRALGERDSRETLRLPWISLKDLLEEWFDSDLLRGALAFLGLRGTLQGPFASGTAYGLLHQWTSGEALERHTSEQGVAGIVTQLVDQLRARGVKFQIGQSVQAIELDGDQAVGLRLKSGEVIKADRVFCDYDAAYTFSHWLSPRDIETSFAMEVAKMRYNGCVVRLNLGLESLPTHPDLTPADWRGGLILTPGLAGTEKAYDPTKYGNFPQGKGTVIEAALVGESPTSVSLWGQYYPYKNGDPTGLLKAAWQSHFPNVAIQAEEELTPRLLESRFALTQGHLAGGDQTINQALFARPAGLYRPGCFPIANLYLCGSTVHPGGYSGLAGRLAANECLHRLALA